MRVPRDRTLCLDAPRLEVAVARPLLVSMHDRIEAERRWLRGILAGAGRLSRLALREYDACLVRLGAVVLGIVAGEGWVCCPFRQERIADLRAATIEVVDASLEAC